MGVPSMHGPRQLSDNWTRPTRYIHHLDGPRAMFPVILRQCSCRQVWSSVVVLSVALAVVLFSMCNFVLALSTHHHGLLTTEPPKYAFVTSLAADVEERGFSDNSTDTYEGSHFVAVRILVYHLLHAPSTKSTGHIPVLVMVAPDISPAKVDRLKMDGAIVVATPRLDSTGAKSSMLSHAMNDIQLRMFQLTTFNRLLYLDADLLVTHPLEAIFRDPAAMTFPTGFRAARAADEGHLPAMYAFAARCKSVSRYRHVHLAKGSDHFSTKLILFKPDKVLFQHYESIMNVASRKSNISAEQDVLNHAHRGSGNMPWKRLGRKWDTSVMDWGDYLNDVTTLHNKWWSWQSQEPDTRAKALWRQHWHEMESFYRDRSRHHMN